MTAFTLLEVCLAVAILALVGLSIYRFLELNLQAIAFSTTRNTEALAMEALIATVQAELNALPEPQAVPGALLGESHKFKDLPADEMMWVAGAGNGLFTEHAETEYNVTLRLLPDAATAKLPTLGLRRMLNEKDKEQNWLPLIDDVRALEFRYFDNRQSAWLENWTGRGARPALVRMRVWRRDEVDPYEAILSLPRVNSSVAGPGERGQRRPPGRPGDLRPGDGTVPAPNIGLSQ